MARNLVLLPEEESDADGLDIPTLKRAIILNGVTCLNMMKTDVLNTHLTRDRSMYFSRAIGDKQTDQVPYNLGAGNLKPVYKKFTRMGRGMTDISPALKNAGKSLNNMFSFIRKMHSR